jgi:hypothetical protein
MRVLVSDAAVQLIADQGGRLYVWPRKARCCGGLTRLVSSCDPAPKKEFRRAPESDRFELYLPTELSPLPDELHVEAHRFPRRIESYWNGCAWVV